MKRIFSLKKNKEILSVLKKGKKISSTTLNLHYYINRKNINFRYAISVSKKISKVKINDKVCSAVRRNYIRRVVSDIVHKLYKQNLISKSLDLFIICKHEILDKTYTEIYDDLNKTLLQISHKYS